MHLRYTFTISEVDFAAQAMLVHYTAAGFPDQCVGVPTPAINEPVEAVVARYAPLHAWAQWWRIQNPDAPLPEAAGPLPMTLEGTLSATLK